MSGKLIKSERFIERSREAFDESKKIIIKKLDEIHHKKTTCQVRLW